MSEEKVSVSLEEVNLEADGTAECSLKTDGISITIKGKQELVCAAISALFNDHTLAVEFMGNLKTGEIRELLSKLDAVAGAVKDDGQTMYHLNISPP